MLKDEKTKSNILQFEVSSISSEAKIVNELLEEAGIQRGKRDFYVAYYAVTEGKNSNGAIFTKEEMEKSYKTFFGTQVNWEHYSDRNVGQNVFAKMTEYGKKSAIIVLAKFIRYYPNSDYVFEVENRHQGGTLRFSMECAYETVTCEKCEEKFDYYSSWCEHLSAGAGRVLGGIEFLGSAVVVNPADKKAKSIALAKEKTKENEMDFEKMYNELKAEFEKANEENSNKVVELEEKIKKIETEKETEVKEIASKLEESENKNVEMAKELETAENLKNEETKKRVNMERANKIKEVGLNPEEIKEKMNYEEASDEAFNAFVLAYEMASNETTKQTKTGIGVEDKEETKEIETASENKEEVEENEFTKLVKGV